jgi:pyruvate dehydrogenase E1 component
MVKHLSDDQLKKMTLGGHDPIKVYNAYKAAVEHKGAPTVVIARTIKGYGLGEAGEGKNITHQQKKMNEDELRAFAPASAFRSRTPTSTARRSTARLKRAAKSGMRERRTALGGFIPNRKTRSAPSRPLRTTCSRSFPRH